MIECDRCGDEFDEQQDYLRHLGKAHEEDLSEMERKRVGELDEEPFPWAIVMAGAIVVSVMGVVLYMVMFAGGSTSSPSSPSAEIEPGVSGSDHYHGPIEVYRDGERIDLSQRRYQLTADRFHMEGGDGRTWHAHATDVSLGFGLRALGFDEDQWQETRVNGRSVDPSQYVLEDGDEVNVTVSS